MKMRFRPTTWVLCALATSLATAAAHAAPTRYKLVDLGELAPTSISSQSMITGMVNGWTGGAWYPGGREELVREPGYDYSQAWGINDQNQIVGTLCRGRGGQDCAPVMWNEWQVQRLGTLAGPADDAYYGSHAVAINERGQIVGTSYNGQFEQATLWDQGQVIGLATPPGYYARSIAQDINETGQIVGYSFGAYNLDHVAALWQDGSVTKLPDLTWQYGSEAMAINDAGWIVGSSFSQNDWGDGVFRRAVIWKDGAIAQLASPWARNDSEALDINNQGLVVGSGGDGSSSRALLWDEAGQAVVLDTLLEDAGSATLGIATSINDAGQIVASGTDGNGQWRYYLLDPVQAAVPEPGTWAMAVAGLAFVGLRRTRAARGARPTR